ncbi:MAG TPA: 3-phosphoshikimate 1-carboxyvinyltransferase, partial [Cytophagales bacterium]|nr:3-phosphoshikimate 1-carboxyvinyltransferase [Cytophagales bacterium]
LVSSKSESNRALIINAVGGNMCNLSNLSEARDTQTMQRLLGSGDPVLDVIDAGTTMRFLTAYLSLKGASKTLTGTPRMCERPIGILVDALRVLGANITYENKDGYPPLRIAPYHYSGNNRIKIKGDVSSQFISALLMSSPLLPEGLYLELEGKIASKPYIEMTLDLMRHFGVNPTWVDQQTIHVPKQTYKAGDYTIESDWSGASYWFSIVSLSKDAQIELLGLKENSLQGDSAIVDIMSDLGVKSEFTGRGVRLSKSHVVKNKSIDFSDCPDLAQTVAVCAAAHGVDLTLTGLESLRIKETDRVAAIQNELQSYGADMVEVSPNVFKITRKDNFGINPNVIIKTYDDHRMAMAFAPLAMIGDIQISEPDVVKKSYPGFWNDLKSVGFQVLNS